MKLIKYIVIPVMVMSFLILPNISNGYDEEKRIIGEIIELVPQSRIIQVGNLNFIITDVFIDDGSEELKPANFWNLEEGSLVDVRYRNEKGGYWKAEKVILFVGKGKEEMLKAME